MEKSIAVVVSYNRAALLAECITALRSQTRRPDAILVVNNGSTDNTENWLKQQEDIFFITQNNVGSSGGFNTGITWAYQHGYTWVWCMDDDGYPKEDALETLLQNETSERSLLNCAVINKDDKKSFVWKTGNYRTIDEVEDTLIKNIGHPFNGTLIHRSIIEKVGTPNHRLFLWGDETEYYYRIVKTYHIPVYTVAKSIHYHPATSFSYKKDWDFSTSWKIYYYVRNRLVIHKAKFSNKAVALFNYVCFLVAFAGIILFYQKTNKLKKLNFIIWPVADAFMNDFSATPPLILNRLKEADRAALPLSLFAPVQHLWNSFFASQSAIQRNPAAA